MSKTRAKSKSKATHQGLPVSHSHINSKKCLTHEGASNQPTYATDINIVKEKMVDSLHLPLFPL